MPYGTIKIDTITFTDGGVDKSVPVSGLILNPTFTGNVTVTGTISGNIIQGGTTVSGLTVTGTTANFASGVFTTQISGVTITGTTVSTTTGNFTSLTGTTATITSGIIASGTAALPSLAILSDPNTGIYSPGADQLAVATNGVERVEFGTAEVVFNDGGENYDFRIEGDTVDSLFFVDASADNVGIGTSSPGTKLDVVQNSTGVIASLKNLNAANGYGLVIESEGASATRYALMLRNLAQNVIYGGVSTTTGQIGFWGLGADPAGTLGSRLTVNGGASIGGSYTAIAAPSNGAIIQGNVGIGTSAPATTVEIQGSNNTLINSRGNLFVADGGTAAQAAGEGGQISFGAWLNGDLSSPYPVATIKGVTESSTLNINLGALLFGTSDTGATITERMRITSGGNVGIGSTAPDVLLTAKLASGPIARFRTADTNFFGIDIGTDGASQTFIESAKGGSGSYQPLAFWTGGSQRATIDTSGRLLVGTTTTFTNGSNSQFGKFQMVGNTFSASGHGILAIGRGEAASSITNNEEIGIIPFTDNDGNTFAQIVCAADADAGAVSDFPGRLVFSTTADGGSSPTERMRIKADGDVSIVTGNLIIGTAGKGIDFSATANSSGTMTSELLDDYEVGTWTPIDSSGAGLTFTSTAGSYTKIGNLCYVSGALTFPSTANASSANIGGLPFNPSSATQYQNFGPPIRNSKSLSMQIFGVNNTTFLLLGIGEYTTYVLNSAMTSGTMQFSFTYQTA